MLKELEKYSSLGNPSLHWELIDMITERTISNSDDAKLYFYNRVVEDESIFDGYIPLLLSLGVLNIGKDGKYIISLEGKKETTSKPRYSKYILNSLLDTLVSEASTTSILNSNTCSYESVYDTIAIKQSAFSLRHSNIRHFLLDFSFMDIHPDAREELYIVNRDWKTYFDTKLAPYIRTTATSLKDLLEIKRKQMLAGEAAEKFIIKYEIERLNNAKRPQWIAPYDVQAGYDILSYNTKVSSTFDRLIEVKSYSGNEPSFYWSKNEIKTAKANKQRYYLYLVNSSKMDSQGYSPTIISNPAEKVLDNPNWHKEIEKYYIKQN